MGRSGEARKPFAATAHNVYLLLYPTGALKRLLEEQPELNRVVFEYLRSIEVGHLLSEGRVYGGGLHKLEPRELARVPAAALWGAIAAAFGRSLPIKPEQLALAWLRHCPFAVPGELEPARHTAGLRFVKLDLHNCGS